LGYAPGWNLYQYVNGMPWGAVDPMGLADPGFLDYLFGALQVVDEVLDAILSPVKGGGADELAASMDHGIRDKEEIARDLADSPFSDAADSYVGGLRNYQRGMNQAADLAETSVLFTVAPGLNIESGFATAAELQRGFRVVEQNGRTLAKLADGRILEISAAQAARLRKAAESKHIVIGESMNRVRQAAQRYGAETFELTESQISALTKLRDKAGAKAAEEMLWRLNRQWLDAKIRDGYSIIDIGVDVDRATRGPFYRREIEHLREKGVSPTTGQQLGSDGCFGAH